ncbi:OmpA family protein [uncultured Cytophaga sp.]|uniref:OmpA family protein n=1 Tax=uncultured Cytophaga sp. TaxID=160238 RepID=UPI002616BCCF|nr:OmpA family protein [uncultured Cytophaga sp.]
MKISSIFFSVSLLCLFFSMRSQAQNTKVLKRQGEKCYRKEQYRNAYPFFDQILKTDTANLNALYKRGVCNLHRFSKDQALKDLQHVYAIDSTYNKYLYFWLGRANHLNYNFEKAEYFYSRFQKEISKKKVQFKEVERYKYQLTCAAKYVSNPSDYFIRNLGSTINSSFSDHSPVLSLTDTLLLFTSRRTNAKDPKEEYDGEPFEDIFYSTKIDSIHWTEPVSFQLNTTGHDASIQLYDNDNKIFIYSYLHGGDIYTSTKENGTWSTPQSLEEINTVDFEADAFITPDGKTLYYATNHFKKNGDLDIYYLTKNDDGTWSKPTALSSVINTNEDEDAPYISADGLTMYFSSRGHTSMGGYDIFKSTWDGASNNWSKPVNLGYPVNTPDDDLYFIMSHTSPKAYFSSYRTEGYGEKDIYEMSSIESVMIDGLLVDGNKLPVNQSTLSVRIQPTASASKNAQSKDVEVQKDGTFSLSALSSNSYIVSVFDGKELILQDTVDVPLSSVVGKHQMYTCVLPTKQQPDSSVVDTVANNTIIARADSTKTSKTSTVVKNSESYIYYFALNVSDVSTSNKADLNKIIEVLNENPAVKIVLSGHADASGTVAINTIISLRRANSIKNYIVSKGISAARITVESFGSSKPVASNDTAAGRAKNRRVELKVQSTE